MANIIDEILKIPTVILEVIGPTDPPYSSIFILLVGMTISIASTLVSRRMIDINKLKRLTKEQKAYNKLRMQMLKTADKKLKLKFERNKERMNRVNSELSMMRMKPLMITFIPLMIVFFSMSGYYDPGITNYYVVTYPSGYVYDDRVESIPFEDLPNDWMTPNGTAKAEYANKTKLKTEASGNIPAIIPFPLPEVLLFRIGYVCKVEGMEHLGNVFVPQYLWWYLGASITVSSILQKISGLQPD